MKITPSMDLSELAREMRTEDLIAAGFMSGLLTPLTGMDTQEVDPDEWEYMLDEAFDKARDERAAEYLSRTINKAQGEQP